MIGLSEASGSARKHGFPRAEAYFGGSRAEARGSKAEGGGSKAEGTPSLREGWAWCPTLPEVGQRDNGEMEMTYTIKAHPTKYRGIEFRSRLEASWAAMFDQLGWNWDYEPFDLNGWVPDFIIRGRYRDVLVEVKPTEEMALAAADKAISAAPDACILFLADGPQERHTTFAKEFGVCTTVGWATSPFYAITPNKIRRTNLNCVVENAKPVSPPLWDVHLDGDRYCGVISGIEIESYGEVGPDGKFVGRYFSPYEDLRPLWNEAQNITRWKPRAAR